MQTKLIVTILAGVLLLLTGIVQARVSSMTVSVDGMACPFCAFGVEKRLKKVNGVATIAVDMKTGTANLVAKPKASIHYQEVPGAIKDAGFTAGVMKVTVSGTLATEGSSSFVLVYDGPSLFVHPGDDTMATRINELAGSGKIVVLAGVLSKQADNTWSVIPESLEGSGQ